MQSRNNRNVFLTVISVIAIALGVFLTVTLTRPEPTANGQLQTAAGQQNSAATGLVLPLTQLEGMWKYEKDGSQFKAVVAGDRIDIKILSNDGTTVNYWLGTFKPAESPGHNIDSARIETDEVYLSRSKNKVFSIGSDSLSFDFSAMGVTKTVVMTRA